MKQLNLFFKNQNRIYLFLFVGLFFCHSISLAQNARVWSTYYGGSGIDIISDIATDSKKNIYISGSSNSPNNIAFNGLQNVNYGGGAAAFLAKFDSLGNRIWATYYGTDTTHYSYANSVVVDNNDNVYMAGHTNKSTGIASGGFQNTHGGGFWDAFLVKFDASGNRLWGTYYGGPGDDVGTSVKVDNTGNVYLVGTTSSTSNIASGGFQNTYGGGTSDVFLVKLDASGNRLWATYYGGNNEENGSLGGSGTAIATDNSGNVFLASKTKSLSSIASGGFQNTYGGGDHDAFLVKFDASGNRLWATYYGGSGDDGVEEVYTATDINGNIYLSGNTDSQNAIASPGAFKTTLSGPDAFLAKFDSNGNRIWGTYYGGWNYEAGGGVETDVLGNVYLVGYTYSGNGIAMGGFQNTIDTINDFEDVFLVKFSPSGSRICATYFGGGGAELPGHEGIAVSGNSVYIGGVTYSSMGLASGGFQNSFGGGNADAYLVKFTSCSSPSGIEIVEEDYEEEVIYPNPSKGVFKIKLETDAQIVITDIYGRKIFDKYLLEGIQEINLEGKAEGVYFVKTITGVKESTKRIVLVD